MRKGPEIQHQVHLRVGEEFLSGGGAVSDIELFLAVLRDGLILVVDYGELEVSFEGGESWKDSCLNCFRCAQDTEA